MYAWPLDLPGSLPNVKPKLECSKCGKLDDAHAGVHLSSTRWRCGPCWRKPRPPAKRTAPLIHV